MCRRFYKWMLLLLLRGFDFSIYSKYYHAIVWCGKVCWLTVITKTRISIDIVSGPESQSWVKGRDSQDTESGELLRH